MYIRIYEMWLLFTLYLPISTIVFTVPDSRGSKCPYFLSPFEHMYIPLIHISTVVILENASSETKRNCRLICEQLPTVSTQLHWVVSQMGATGDRQRPRLSQSQEYKGKSGTSLTRHSELYSTCMQFSVMHHRQRNQRYMHERMIDYPSLMIHSFTF